MSEATDVFATSLLEGLSISWRPLPVVLGRIGDLGSFVGSRNLKKEEQVKFLKAMAPKQRWKGS
jgi:hypothetical protein